MTTYEQFKWFYKNYWGYESEYYIQQFAKVINTNHTVAPNYGTAGNRIIDRFGTDGIIEFKKKWFDFCVLFNLSINVDLKENTK